MKKRFTEKQIIRILQEAESGMKVMDVCRKHAIYSRLLIKMTGLSHMIQDEIIEFKIIWTSKDGE